MSLTFNEEVITQIFHLSRLGAESREDVVKIQEDLNNIVQMVSQIAKSDTNNVEPMAHPLSMSQPLRPDEVTESNERDLLQKLAPKIEAGLYIVPVVIEE